MKKGTIAEDVHVRGAHHCDENGRWCPAIGYRLSAIGYFCIRRETPRQGHGAHLTGTGGA